MSTAAPPIITKNKDHHSGGGNNNNNKNKAKMGQDKPTFQVLQQRLKRVQDRLQAAQTGAEKDNHELQAALQDRITVIQGKLEALEQQKGKNIEERLERIQAKLETETDPEAIQKLKERLEKLRIKSQQQQQKNNSDKFMGVPEKCLSLEKRIERVEGLLQKESDPSRRAMWEGRLELLKEKLAFKERHQMPTMKDRLKWQERLLAIDCNPQRREEIARRIARIQARQRNMERKQQMLKDPVKVEQKRDALKNKLLQREAEILATHNNKDGKDSKAFKKLVLQKVYVAHYPLDLYAFIPPHKNDGGPELTAKRADIRKVAMERARAGPRVDWISPDEYERLPKIWTLEKELAWFGKQGGGEPGSHPQPGKPQGPLMMERKREAIKAKLLKRQQQAAKNKNEMALKKIALWQVVLAHYPEPAKIAPLFHGKAGPEAMEKRAEVRKVSLEMAQMQPHVSWMTEEQYARLPKTWSLEQEKATFGKNDHANKAEEDNDDDDDEEEEIVVVPEAAAMDLSGDW